MRVLQLCYKPPYPPVDGGTLAMNSITQGLLSSGCEVRVLSMESDKHPADTGRMPEEYLQQTRFKSVYVDLSVRPLDAAVALLCGKSYNVKRFESKDFECCLAEILQSEQFDVIHVESIFLTPYLPTIRKHSNAAVVLRAHNVEHRIWRQMADDERNPLKRWYLKKLALALRQYELGHLNDYDGVACISAADADTFRSLDCRKPLTDIPFGIDVEPVDNVDPEPDTLFHIGSMDWRPNEEGVRWFIREVWPLMHSELPQLRLFLAGRKMPDDLMALQVDGIRVVGEVQDASYFMASKQLNVVPLLAGSGIRVKIIEAMALGKVVITTSVGASGIDCTDGVNLLIADTPRQFVDQVRRCIESPELCSEIGRNARGLILEKYGNEALTKRLLGFYNKISGSTLL